MSTLRALAVTKGLRFNSAIRRRLGNPLDEQAINPDTDSPDFTADQAVAFLRKQPDA
jgi:hypothetical protein